MGRRITGSLVSKGDLVKRKFTQLRFEYEKRDIHAERMNRTNEVGVVISTIPPYDRTTHDGDCFVFWSRTKSVVLESSYALRILSPACAQNG